jgi:hypothetical protein
MTDFTQTHPGSHNKAWRRFTRSCWQLLIPALLGIGLGNSGIWAAALAAAGPGMGRGAALARKYGMSPWQGALAEGLAAAVLAAAIATFSLNYGAETIEFWMALSAWRGYQALASLPGREPMAIRAWEALDYGPSI